MKPSSAVFGRLEATLLQVCVFYPGVCVSLAWREGEKRQLRKKLERNGEEREPERDKPTDGKLRGKESSSSLIKRNNCWAQMAAARLPMQRRPSARLCAEIFRNASRDDR